MPQMIFVNLPVADLARSTAFYEAVGFTADPRFAQPGAAAMPKVSDEVAFMLLGHERFADFTGKRIVDARSEVEALFCLSRESREAVAATAERAIAAGARPDLTPRQDMGFMYGRSIEDPDGHVIEFVWMDVDAALTIWADNEATA